MSLFKIQINHDNLPTLVHLDGSPVTFPDGLSFAGVVEYTEPKKGVPPSFASCGLRLVNLPIEFLSEAPASYSYHGTILSADAVPAVVDAHPAE